MIEDLEGATPEPARRRHVVGLSVATAAGAAVLFLTLVLAPLEIDPLPRASLPRPTASAVPVANALTWPTILSSIDQARQRACSYGSGTQWLLVTGVSIDGPSRLPSVRTAPRPNAAGQIPMVQASQQPTLWMTVTCSPVDVLPPTVDLKNIAR